LYNINNQIKDGLMISNPVSVFLSAPPCFEKQCNIEITMPILATFESKKVVGNQSEFFVTHCGLGDLVISNFTCSNGFVLNTSCDGKFVGTIIKSCPMQSFSNQCKTLTRQLSTNTNSGCWVKLATSTNIVCVCPFYGNKSRALQQSMSTDSSSSISIVSMLNSIQQNVATTIISVDSFNYQKLKREQTALLTLSIFLSLVIFSMIFGYYADARHLTKSFKLGKISPSFENLLC
jgi:hypothetical protein